jgi:hypothetical protein
MSYERPCDACRVLTAVVHLERAPLAVWPLETVCPACLDELIVECAEPDNDNNDDRERGEPECPCRSHCAECTPGVGRVI